MDVTWKLFHFRGRGAKAWSLSCGARPPARAAFTSARKQMGKLVREPPAYGEAICALGMTDAALGHKEDAIREGRRAVELLPVTKDSIIGLLLVQNLALI